MTREETKENILQMLENAAFPAYLVLHTKELFETKDSELTDDFLQRLVLLIEEERQLLEDSRMLRQAPRSSV